MALLAKMSAPRGGKLLSGAALALLGLAATLAALLPSATQAASRTTTATARSPRATAIVRAFISA